MNLNNLVTESRNKQSENIDMLSTIEIVKCINSEDCKVPLAVGKESEKIAKAIDIIAFALQNEGRLIYIGAGTSGRLGVLDASECPPTYGTDPLQILGIIAGGEKAIRSAVENAEDSEEQAVEDLIKVNLNKNDVLVGIAASGRTPYVISAIEYAKRIGTKTIGVSCNPDSKLSKVAEVSIAPLVGPEVLTGSTRMKAGTAQKLILNMLTTGAMIENGKVFKNLMVDVQTTNLKLIQRQKNIVVEATGASIKEAETALKETENHTKSAIVMILLGVDANKAKDLLRENKDNIRLVLQNFK
ncbi:N-acetylmuramic acid 6-phosphate etherase [Clostridium sediminicola]